MARFVKRPVVVEAVQWFRDGDHTEVRPYSSIAPFKDAPCLHCGHNLTVHGLVNTFEGRHIVCPGDWIITGVAKEVYPCKPAIFAATYDSVAT